MSDTNFIPEGVSDFLGGLTLNIEENEDGEKILAIVENDGVIVAYYTKEKIQNVMDGLQMILGRLE